MFPLVVLNIVLISTVNRMRQVREFKCVVHCAINNISALGALPFQN